MTCANLTVFFLNYKVVHYFWNLFLDVLSQKWMITALKEKCHPFNFVSSMLRKIWSIYQKKISQPGVKITTIFRLSKKCLNRIIIKTFKNTCFASIIKIMLCLNNNSVNKNINTQQALFFSFLEKPCLNNNVD